MSLIAHVANLFITLTLVNSVVPEPYMDEIFHIPQAQQYCQGDYVTWNPKLTTPPGLYIFSNGIACFGHLLKYDLCTVTALRFTNILFSIGLYFVLLALILRLSNVSASWRTNLYALSLCWFPVGFFYNFVYYTDPGSTFFVLFSYLLVKQKRYHLAGMMGLISMTFRQTNVIWVCLFMMVTIIDTLSTKKNDDDSVLYNPTCSQLTGITDMFKIIQSLLITALTSLTRILPNIFTFLLSVVLFAIFLVWNGGIVLGDKSNHIAGLHFPQIFYYTSFVSFFAAPFTLSSAVLQNLFSQVSIKSLLLGVISSVISLYLIHKYTYEHPFLLSDNRHYSFYVWKKIYKRHWTVRYLLAPIYLVSSCLNLQAFANHTSFLVCLGYIVAVILSLVPSPLLEFRYFIIPFIFYMIHIPPPTQLSRTLIALTAYLAIHIVTVYLFLYKPFIWSNEPDQVQRFMW